MKRALASLLLVMLGLVVGLALGEMLLRLFPDSLPFALRTDLKVDDEAIGAAHQKRSTLLIEDGYLGRVLRPGASLLVEGHPDYTYSITTISLGFGEAGFRDDGLDGPVYAVAVGDSFTFGDGVEIEEVWVERLEAALGRDVANLGVPGYSSIQNMRNLAAYGLLLEPEVVLWAFFNNDPADDFDFQAWLASGEPSYGGWQLAQQAEPRAEVDRPEVALASFNASLAQNSRVYTVACLAAEASQQRYQPYVDQTLDYRFKFDEIWEWYLNPDETCVEYGLTLAQFNILEGKRLADEQGVDFVLLLIPFKEQVYWSIVSRYVDGAQGYDVDWMTRAMLDFCDANHLTCLDLLPGFRARAERGEQLYFRTDGHWNTAGHALTAELVMEALAEHGQAP